MARPGNMTKSAFLDFAMVSVGVDMLSAGKHAAVMGECVGASGSLVLQDFKIVPDLCNAAELEELFTLVNTCDEYEWMARSSGRV